MGQSSEEFGLMRCDNIFLSSNDLERKLRECKLSSRLQTYIEALQPIRNFSRYSTCILSKTLFLHLLHSQPYKKMITWPGKRRRYKCVS